MKITVLVDNKTENTACDAEWGLSLLLEVAGKKILYDAGATDMFIRNAEALKLDLAEVEAVVISHGHYDHTGGIPELLRLNDKCRVYIREAGFRASFAKEADGEYKPVGIRWTEEERKAFADRLVLTKERDLVADSLELVSAIPAGLGNNFYWLADDEYVADDMSHEQLLLVHEYDKLVVFSGCSHNGVLPILDYVKKLYPDKEIAAFVAGMHLFGKDDATLDALLAAMEEYGVQKYVPLHCTGLKAIMKMKAKFGDRCVIAMSGDVVSL